MAIRVKVIESDRCLEQGVPHEFRTLYENGGEGWWSEIGLMVFEKVMAALF